MKFSMDFWSKLESEKKKLLAIIGATTAALLLVSIIGVIFLTLPDTMPVDGGVSGSTSSGGTSGTGGGSDNSGTGSTPADNSGDESSSADNSGNASGGSSSGGQDPAPVPPASDPTLTMRKVSYGDSRLVATICSLTDFGAVANDDGFDDDALFDAIEYAGNQGGGTIWVPAGRYKFKENFVLPNGVYIMGEWENPDSSPSDMTKGSIFEVYGGKRAPSGAEKSTIGFTGVPTGDTPFMILGAGSGVIGMTVYYPEQNHADPQAYPPTFMSGDTLDGSSGFSVVKYTTIVNPWIGIVMGPSWNELGMVDHVYMSPLKAGYFANMTTDIGKIMDLSISSQYYAQFDSSVNRDILTAKMKALTVGVEVQRSDWQYIYHMNIRDVHTGYRISRFENATDVTDGTNSQLYDIKMSNVVIGIDAHYSKLAQQFTLLNIQADKQAVRIGSAFKGHVAIMGSSLGSSSDSAVHLESGSLGTLSMSDTTVTGFGSGHYAVKANGGSLVVENCTSKKGGENLLLDGADACTINRNTGITVKKNKVGRFAQGTDSHASKDLYSNAIDLGAIPNPGGDALVSVLDHGADRTGKTDSTAAFEKGLAAVKSQGGGILYVPAGRYLINGTLTVPTGVELRGCFESGHHSNAGGTVLVTTQGKGSENGTPFITLQANAGLTGVTIWYAEQNAMSPIKYPPAVYSSERSVWVVNTCIGNAWQGLKLQGDTGGHYVSNLTGFSFYRDIHIDGAKSKGYVINCHFNPHFYARTLSSRLPGGDPTPGDKFGQFLGRCDSTVDGAVAFGKTTDEQVFQVFNYRGGVGLRLLKTSSGAFSGKLLGIGFDGARRPIVIDDTSGTVNFVNPGVDCVPGNSAYVVVNGGRVNLVNLAASAFNFTPDEGLVVSGGTVELRLGCFGGGGRKGTIVARGGSTTVSGAVIRHIGPISGMEFSNQQSGDCLDFVKGNGTLSLGCNLARLFLNNTGVTSPYTIYTNR